MTATPRRQGRSICAGPGFGAIAYARNRSTETPNSVCPLPGARRIASLAANALRALALLALLAACGPAAEPAAPEIRPVRVVTVEERAGGETVSLTGTVQAQMEVNLAFRIDGRHDRAAGRTSATA